MRKGFMCLVLILVAGLIFSPYVLAKEKPIKIGINAEITGDIPKVGEGTKFAAQMWLEDVKKAGGIKVGAKTYPVVMRDVLDFMHKRGQLPHDQPEPFLRLIEKDSSRIKWILW